MNRNSGTSFGNIVLNKKVIQKHKTRNKLKLLSWETKYQRTLTSAFVKSQGRDNLPCTSSTLSLVPQSSSKVSVFNDKTSPDKNAVASYKLSTVDRSSKLLERGESLSLNEEGLKNSEEEIVTLIESPTLNKLAPVIKSITLAPSNAELADLIVMNIEPSGKTFLSSSKCNKMLKISTGYSPEDLDNLFLP